MQQTRYCLKSRWFCSFTGKPKFRQDLEELLYQIGTSVKLAPIRYNFNTILFLFLNMMLLDQVFAQYFGRPLLLKRTLKWLCKIYDCPKQFWYGVTFFVIFVIILGKRKSSCVVQTQFHKRKHKAESQQNGDGCNLTSSLSFKIPHKLC